MGDFFRSNSGVIFELDVPREGTMQRERHDEKVERGDLVALDVEPVKVDNVEGDPSQGYRWEIPAPAAARRAPAKAKPADAED